MDQLGVSIIDEPSKTYTAGTGQLVRQNDLQAGGKVNLSEYNQFVYYSSSTTATISLIKKYNKITSATLSDGTELWNSTDGAVIDNVTVKDSYDGGFSFDWAYGNDTIYEFTLDLTGIDYDSTTTINGTTYYLYDIYYAFDSSAETAELIFYNTPLYEISTLTGLENVTSFYGTFYGCTGLTSIPEDLFSSNTNATYFYRTFYGCTGLTSIPEDLFSSNTNARNFSYTFYDCTGLTEDFTIKIGSEEVTNAAYFVGGVKVNVTIQVPSDSTTYDTFTSDTLNTNDNVSVTIETY